MKRLFVLLAALAAMASIGVGSAFAGGGTGITATPAHTATFDGGNCTATFVRSASGIINETNRACQSGQNPWTDANVWLQFRPQTGPTGPGSSPIPNPNCDPNGLVLAPFTFVNHEGSIGGTPSSGYFINPPPPTNSDPINSYPYNVCVYLVNPQVASGTVDSAVMAGTTATLPVGLHGHFRIDVNGSWDNTPFGYVDAEYNSGTSHDWSFHQDGWPGFGEGWGDLLVNGGLVNWGAYDGTNHAYSYSLPASGSIDLNVFDGDATDPGHLVYVPSWYNDNVGSLNYTITYLGL